MAGTLVREQGSQGFVFGEPALPKRVDSTRLRGLAGVTALIRASQDDQLHFGTTGFAPEYPLHHTEPDIRLGTSEGEQAAVDAKPGVPRIIGRHATANAYPDSAVDRGPDYHIG